MIIKMDMANVCDRVNHSFLFLFMQKLGFNNEIISWIKACIGSPYITPLIDGHPTPFFTTSRGLRQGFPLLPLLYIIMTEDLSSKLEVGSLDGSLVGLNCKKC